MSEIFTTAMSLSEAVSFSQWVEGLRFLGIRLINISDFVELFFRFVLNTGVVLLILQFVYAKNSRQKDFYFSYLAVGVIVFLLCFLLNSVKLELGFALGLFAIFGIIRYRTDAIPIKEMTYLFIVIGISVMNALANKKVSYAELLLTNSVVFFGLMLLEKRLKLKQEGSLCLIYDDISLMHLNSHDILMQKLKERTGIEITRFEVEKIDYLKDIAVITVYFYPGNDGFPKSIKQKNKHDDTEL